MNKRIVFVLTFIFLIIISSCQKDDVKNVKLNLNDIDVNRFVISGSQNDIDTQKPFDDNTKAIVKNMVDLLNSGYYVSRVEDSGDCDGGDTLRFHLYLKNGDHYEIYSVSVSNNNKCYSYIKVVKNDKIYGFTDDFGSNTLLELFLH